ncbi:MAG: pantetheine-phosphate adenylyltransferase [Ancrocorticia sp.]|uniref:pantetheine-phosphate adenylyltransferase n=1 Tax=Ancrocorticia sp. TaxID=2593684 RepID=UPI003F92D173
MTIAVCPGSYDPVTLGHLDVIDRAAAMFDEVIVVVAQNHAKKYLFAADERVELVRQAVADRPTVRVVPYSGLMAEFCAEVGASVIVKGLRGAADFDGEQAMALMNRHLTGIETVFVMGNPAMGHIASSMVKDVAHHGGKIDDLVPSHVAEALREKENR